MTHWAAAAPNLIYASDTHYPWNEEDDIVQGGPLQFVDGAFPVPTAPGLGVEVDEERLQAAHERYLQNKAAGRDDVSAMQERDPTLAANAAAVVKGRCQSEKKVLYSTVKTHKGD